MAKAGITIQVMPESTEIDLKVLETKVKEVINKTYGDVGEIRVSEEPIAFGLIALKFLFIIDEKQGTDIVEEALLNLEEVGNARVIDFRRAIG
jgi:translation elongation factor aEF-1 beta